MKNSIVLTKIQNVVEIYQANGITVTIRDHIASLDFYNFIWMDLLSDGEGNFASGEVTLTYQNGKYVITIPSWMDEALERDMAETAAADHQLNQDECSWCD